MKTSSAFTSGRISDATRTQYSINEYRERFDVQNIALTKFQEIKKAKNIDHSFQVSNVDDEDSLDQNFITGMEFTGRD